LAWEASTSERRTVAVQRAVVFEGNVAGVALSSVPLPFPTLETSVGTTN
jgi:hypothetical protein